MQRSEIGQATPILGGGRLSSTPRPAATRSTATFPELLAAPTGLAAPRGIMSRMAFSIKGLLALTGYAAMAAAAIATGHWAFVDLLWAITFLAIAYATIVAVFARGRRQKIAGGFAATALLLLACLGFSPDSVPTGRIIVLAGRGSDPPSPQQVGALYTTEMSPPDVADGPVMLSGTLNRTSGSDQGIFINSTIRSSAAATYAEQTQWIAAYRAANAAATMLAGLAGCLLAAVAQRRSQRDEQ
jgi:hypothetical protein